MPTYGWIEDSDTRRWLENNENFPDPDGRPLPPRYPCPFCGALFLIVAELQNHLLVDHKGERPFLSLAGHEPQLQDSIRQSVRPDQILVFAGTNLELSVDGGPLRAVSAADLRSCIASARLTRLRLRIANQFEKAAAPVVTEYDLQFRIASTSELSAVDSSFVKHLGRSDPTIVEVDDFLQGTDASAARDYAAALADYVLAVLAKDGDPKTGISGKVQDYRRRFNGSIRTLQTFERPLAHLIASLARFSSNDFSSAGRRCDFGPLDAANSILGKLVNRAVDPEAHIESRRAPSEGRSIVCPIDAGTDNIVRRCEQLTSMPRWSTDIQEILRADCDRPSMDSLDRVKLQALWAWSAIRHGQRQNAVEPLRALVGNDCFGRWAAARLEECDS